LGVSGAGGRIAVHGHRGAAAVRPENTISSFKEALRVGADYLELDVYPSRDNVLVVTHDPTINPEFCTGGEPKRAVHDMTLAELRRYDCGSGHRRSYPQQKSVPGAGIPTFDEVLDLAKGTEARFNIEIKSSENWKDYTLPPGQIARLVVECVRKHGLEKRVIVQSFDFRVVKAARALAPDFLLAALWSSGERSFVDIAQETGAQMVTPEFKLVTPERVKEAHAAGIQVVPWTVDTPEDWDRLIAAGVDGIITNDPGACVAHLKARGLR
jgi:glycerophosphoryl diester phosphodiesterase